MIKLTYKNLRDATFMQAMMKVARFQGIKDPKEIYNIMRLWTKLQQESKTCDDVFLQMLKQFAILDEKGNIAPDEGRPGTYRVDPAKLSDWQAKLEEFLKIEFEIQRYPLKLTQLAIIGLSAEDLGALEPVLDLEDLKELEKPDVKEAAKKGLKALP